MKFPETESTDADHAWLVPVKGYSNTRAILSLQRSELVGQEFIQSILMLEMEKPLFSPIRCSLLAFVPQKPSPSWKNEFMAALSSSKPKIAQEFNRLLALSPAERKNEIDTYLSKPKSEDDIFQKLLSTRKEVFESEISKNPRGQILEPGFRVIFPESELH